MANYQPYLDFIDHLEKNDYLHSSGTKLKPVSVLGKEIRSILDKQVLTLTSFLNNTEVSDLSTRKRLHCILHNANPSNFRCAICGDCSFLQTSLITYRIPACCKKMDKEHCVHRQNARLNKVKENTLLLHGVEWSASLASVKQKHKDTNIERYGYESIFQVPDFQEKIKSTNLERYGHENVLGSLLIQERVKHTNLLKYNATNPGGLTQTLIKIKNTNLLRYGASHKNQAHLFMDHYNLITTDFLQSNFVDEDEHLMVEELAFFINSSLVRARRMFKEFGVIFVQSGGFDKTKPGTLYYIKDTLTGYYKSGITNKTVKERFHKIFTNEEDRIIILDETFFEIGSDAFDKEQEILEEYKDYRLDNDYWPDDVGGYTEFFSRDIFQLDRNLT